ncbi:MAG: hypothetical protein ABI548_13375 [Polyangiaceae bacterium]
MAVFSPSLSISRSNQRAARWLLRVGLAPLLGGVFGCAAGLPATTPAHEHWLPGYAFGLWDKAELDVRDDCPVTGAESVRIGTTWSTFLVSVATLGVYTPHQVRVHCRAQR